MNEFEIFKEAIERLCKEHGYLLCSTGYDLIVARKMDDGDDPIHGGLEEAGW